MLLTAANFVVVIVTIPVAAYQCSAWHCLATSAAYVALVTASFAAAATHLILATAAVVLVARIALCAAAFAKSVRAL